MKPTFYEQLNCLIVNLIWAQPRVANNQIVGSPKNIHVVIYKLFLPTIVWETVFSMPKSKTSVYYKMQRRYNWLKTVAIERTAWSNHACAWTWPSQTIRQAPSVELGDLRWRRHFRWPCDPALWENAVQGKVANYSTLSLGCISGVHVG